MTLATRLQRRQSCLKYGGCGSGSKYFRFFQGKFPKYVDFFGKFKKNISIFHGKFFEIFRLFQAISPKKFDFPGKNRDTPNPQD